MRWLVSVAVGFFLQSLAAFTPAAAAAPPTVTTFLPSAADPRIAAFDNDNLAAAPSDMADDAPLIVFLSGTNGKPKGEVGFLSYLATLGDPVLGLAYNDAPSVSQVCPKNPDPACAEAFRRMRVEGVGPAPDTIDNPPAEAIESRLVSALRYMAARDARWARYLDHDQPHWDRLILGGHSQGAGMAAYMAQRHAVARVVLFSSPWDTTGRDRQPAPWLSAPSVTPLDRWYAEYHAREKTVDLIRNAYAALHIPPDHIHVFNLDLPVDYKGDATNPYHTRTVHDMRYQGEWRALFVGP